ncbi:hypothetical protein LD119_00455 [Mesoplasma sp. JKS002660]|nr:hypothetical protein [Mesoplasma sp. JKS002660]
MQITKKILLSLTLISSIVLAPYMFDLLHSKGINIILVWFTSFVFLCAAISSICWMNDINNFWLWKLPSLLILPFSIPFLIIDYLESKRTIIIQEPMNRKTKMIIVWILFIINLLIFTFIIVFSSLKGLPWLIAHNIKYFSNTTEALFWEELVVLFLLALGSVFLIINFYYPKKVFKVLSLSGLIFNWFYLSLERIDEKGICFFIKHKNIVKIEKDPNK